MKSKHLKDELTKFGESQSKKTKSDVSQLTMKRKTMKKKLYLFNSMLATALFAAALAVSSCADNDLDKLNSEGDKGAAVSFDVKDVQEAVLADATPDSRAGDAATFNHQLNELGLTSADLEPQVLEAQSPAGMEACLVETTIPGINPMQPDPQTRATVTKTLTADFSTLGYRATSMTAVSSTPDWFYNARTKSSGELYDKLYWSWSENHFGRFYAVFPEVKNTYSKIKLSPATHAGNPYVDFEVDPDVANQKDLMTACSGVVEYQTQGVAPNTSLAFRHALTAIHFTVGQNLWAGRIDKIEISGAINKGTYTLNSDPTQPGTWALGTTTGTFTLSGININTAASPGSVITDDNGNYTFFMIPQQVTGKNIYVDIHFQDNKTIHVPLKGKWLPGTTKTYTLSNLNSNWQYQLQVLGQNNTAAYDATNAGTYTVRSYRQAGGVQLPVAWKIVSYQESADGGLTWGAETQTKPTWLTNLSLTEGAGGTSAQQGSATVKKATMIDKLIAYNNVLKTATPKGSAGNYHDLSMHDYKGVPTAQRNTANSYLISAPGYYKIPLVYGNAITNGNDNPSSYKTTHSGTYILTNFKDHAGVNITSPYINVQNSGNPATQASIVWTDQSGIVEASSLSVTGSGQDSYLNFHVPADKIKNGNAVIAVKNASGTIMWSWHLWFDHKEVLETVKCTNFQNVDYYFTKQTLGFAYRKWKGTTNDNPRVVRVKVEQTIANHGAKQFAYIDIKQNPSSVKEISSTLYQFGRKDAFPGVQTISDGSFTENGGNNMSVTNGIQHPETFYIVGSSWYNNYNQYNLWSMDNTTTGFNDNAVVKTIYDPCPAGFHMPASNAFTGFTTNGDNDGPMNVSGAWDYGWNFNNKISSPDATLYFPASGYRYNYNGSLNDVGSNGYYWAAVLYDAGNGCILYFKSGFVTPQNGHYRPQGFSVRPVSE